MPDNSHLGRESIKFVVPARFPPPVDFNFAASKSGVVCQPDQSKMALENLAEKTFPDFGDGLEERLPIILAAMFTCAAGQ